MSAQLEVVSPGAMATLQDLGRPGWRRWGVPRAGALQPAWLRIANRLVNNPEDAVAIEFFVSGPTLKAHTAPLRLALAGDFAVTLERANGERSQLDAWRSVTLLPGETLRIGAARSAGSAHPARTGYIAVAGLDVPRVLGSASTYTRAQMGGLQGRALAAGDQLGASAVVIKADAAPAERHLPHSAHPAPNAGAIRVVPGPQADHFSTAVLSRFFATGYQVTADADRMGLRLQGQALAHRSDQANNLTNNSAEIVSDATVPGSIQVPGNGQPIVLLADGQTAGGYPKIGTVVSADLPRLAVTAIGTTLRFEAVTVAQAEALARDQEAAVHRLLAQIEPLLMDGGIDLNAIYANNLVSGVIDALAPD